MLQIGIRLHDVNSGLSDEMQTLEARAAKAREEGFCCVHLAPQKVMKGITYDPAAMTEGLGVYFRRVFGKYDLDIAVLGCYLNLAHPDSEKLKDIKERYYGNMRVASLCGAAMVGTETGCPNAEYKLDSNTHTDAALNVFIHNLEDVVRAAEDYGVTMAIEPVWNHIVYDPDRALRVIKSMASRNLRIIFDPVNLLCMENADDRENIFAEAMDKLGDHIAMVHIKDFVRRDGKLVSVAAGTGEMDYTNILRYLKARKPYIQVSLENTCNDNAVASKELIERVYNEI
ncbi:MAG: sugar phosphate isomerase/epimerase [Anaerolineaceae bacterium]|nr:sugar phosphate isomerase/epimerase [Anaerolineaceae bacterium]